MAFTLKIEGNFFVIFNTATPFSEVFRSTRAQTSFIYYQEGGTDFFEFKALGANFIKDVTKYDFTDLRDNRTGAAFSSVALLRAFLSLNLGIESQNIYSGLADKFVFISSPNDFPAAVSGVRTLKENGTYFVTANIDLAGDRLVGASNTTIIGGSSENCTLTSTGLGVGVALFTTAWTTPIRHISFIDVDTALDIDGTLRVVALDWTGVNFVNVPNVGTIDSVDNWIFTKGALLNSTGIILDGTIGTVAFNQFLFNTPTSTNRLFTLSATLTITRRFRVIYSSFIVNAGAIGISYTVGATIPNSNLILDTCNFAGAGNYLGGVSHEDNVALFLNNVGIINSRENSLYYMNGNATETVIAAIGAEVKVAGTTTSGAVTSKFTNTNNRATYIGAIDRLFKLTATMSVESGNNNVIGIYVAKNGALITDSEVYITTNAGGRVEGAAVQAIVQLEATDYLEIWVENATSMNDITVTNMNVIIN